MKKAVMFGGGNIGRGFIGAVLAEAGYHITFADVNMDLINKVNELGTYTVHIVDMECKEQVVNDISGVNSTTQDVVDEIADANLVTTAVGLTILPRIAGAVANGIAARKAAGCEEYLNIIACENAIRASSQLKAGCEEYLNIIACENAIRASSQLKKAVYERMDAETAAYADKYVGFPDCAVDRIVPPVKNNPDKPLDVAVENYYEWSVERSGFKGEIPDVPAMHIVDDLMAYLERKLFTLNTGHCITAYLGVMKGYETIDQAIADEKIYAIAKAAMTESGNGLIAKHGFKAADHWAYVETCLGRYRNPYLEDVLVRVGREPYRKLSATDRLVGPMMNAHNYGFTVDNLIKGIAAGLHYSYEGDAQSQEMQKKIAEQGVLETAKELTGIKNPAVLAQIVKEYDTIAEQIQ